MKIKELENVNFNINEDINIDVSLILFDYAEKEINELLTQYVKTPVIFQNKLKITSLKKLDYVDEFKLSTEVINNFYHVLFNNLKEDEDEKENLINLCIENNRVFMSVLLSNPNIKLNDKQFEKIFNIDIKELFNPHNNYSHKEITFLIDMKLNLIENDNIFISNEKIYNDFFEKDSRFRKAYSKRTGISMVPNLVDKLMNDENIYVDDLLENILQDKNLQLSEKQVDTILNEYGFIERYYLSLNMNINYTDEQIIKGILDDGFSESEYESEIYVGENFNSEDVSYNFLNNKKVLMNETIINGILRDKKGKNYINCLLDREDVKKSKELTELITHYKEKITNKNRM